MSETIGRKMPTETGKSGKKSGYKDKEKPTQIRFSNITAAKGSCCQSVFYCYVDRYIVQYVFAASTTMIMSNTMCACVVFTC